MTPHSPSQKRSLSTVRVAVYGVPDDIVRVDVADGNEYERFQTQKMTKLPGVHRIISHPMKLIKSRD